MRELALFAGAGGGILGGLLLGWRTVCAVEIDPYARSVLLARQNDGTLTPFPVWDDIRTFDGTAWRGAVDVVSGGFPCQDISIAGKGAGIEGERSGLWTEMARVIREVRPRYVFVENSPMLTSLGLGRVLADLAAMGFDAEWGVFGADDCGAPHRRKRIWIMAHADSTWESQPERSEQNERRWISHGGTQMAYAPSARPQEWASKPMGQQKQNAELKRCCCGTDMAYTSGYDVQGVKRVSADASQWQEPSREQVGLCGGVGRQEWPAEPAVGRVVNGLAFRVDRLKALGNGQVPRVAATAWRLMQELLGDGGRVKS